MNFIGFKDYPGTSTPLNAAYMTAFLNAMYPVGKIEMFFDNEDHSDYLGFVWERELVGLTPIGYNSDDNELNSIGKTLGRKTHNHSQNLFYVTNNNNYYLCISNKHSMHQILSPDEFYGSTITAQNVSQSSEDGLVTQYRTDDVSNMQPSKVVAFWKRVK